ncbi:MAG: type II/IV secretion system protein [Candidatus Omnitrophica bacterium]|nr:type II/IV secretion system protein [Candidatus Omnitrophota bacterium]
MPATLMTLRPDAVGARLKDLGIVTPQQLEQAKRELGTTQERFSEILVRLGLLRDAEAGVRLAAQLGGMPQRWSPSAGQAARAMPAAPPESLWAGHRLAPLESRQPGWLVATDDPLSVFALDFFAASAGGPLEAILIRPEDFAALRAPARPAASPPPAAAKPPAQPAAPPAPAPAHVAAPPQQVAAAPTATRRPEAKESAEDAPIVQLVDSMLMEAVRLRASDVHLEAATAQVRVRYRIDGVLHDVNQPPKALHGPLVSRLKIMAGMNIAEKRLPQDGRLQLTVQEHPLDVRVSVLPATHGESVVMRLLDRSQPIRGMAEMGMSADDQARWNTMVRRPHGMVLVTGPTGSGKTTTLYSALSVLNQPDRKLITVEDPVEYQLAGINQVNVRSSIGLTFAAGLRSMLRQAPDVIMVGEIRDQETAQVAIQAALTGHLVLSTLHTNDASSAITRLIDMGIPPFLIASTVQGVLAQRLTRRLCHACRLTDNATAEERAFLGSPEVSQVIRSQGCDACRNSGFFGRLGVFELLIVTDAIRKLVVTKAGASTIRAAAVRDGMRSLRDDGAAKIREGLTTVSEVLRVVVEG